MARDITIPNDELTEFDLPRVCVLTGESQGVVFKDVKFAWYPPWVAALVVVNVIVMAFVAWVLTKRATGKLPFTEAAWAAWRKGRVIQVLSVLGGIILFIAGVFLMASAKAQATAVLAAGGLLLVASIAVPVMLWRRFVKGKTLQVRRITRTHITLRLPSDEACATLQAHLSGGRRAQMMPA